MPTPGDDRVQSSPHRDHPALRHRYYFTFKKIKTEEVKKNDPTLFTLFVTGLKWSKFKRTNYEKKLKNCKTIV